MYFEVVHMYSTPIPCYSLNDVVMYCSTASSHQQRAAPARPRGGRGARTTAYCLLLLYAGRGGRPAPGSQRAWAVGQEEERVARGTPRPPSALLVLLRAGGAPASCSLLARPLFSGALAPARRSSSSAALAAAGPGRGGAGGAGVRAAWWLAGALLVRASSLPSLLRGPSTGATTTAHRRGGSLTSSLLPRARCLLRRPPLPDPTTARVSHAASHHYEMVGEG